MFICTCLPVLFAEAMRRRGRQDSNLTIMTLKLFRAAWFLSMLAVLANLLYVYASLPEQVVLGEGEVWDLYRAGRDEFFYTAMVVIVLANVIVYLFSRKLIPNDEF